MKWNVRCCLKYTFAFLCAVTTFFMVVYWCYKYSLNNDLSVVFYGDFDKNEENIRPTVSMCLQNPFVTDRLDEYGVNESSYLAFLEGKDFSKEMLNVDFHQVTIDIVDYIKGYQMYFYNGTNAKFEKGLTIQDKKSLTHISFIGQYYSYFLKCFAFNIPHIDNLEKFQVLLSNRIFPNGTRPTYNGLNTFVHLPHQVLLSKHTETYVWPVRTRNEIYIMRTLIRGVTIETRRNKKDSPCSQHWKEYDDWVTQRHTNETGCITPYQKQDGNLPPCNTQGLMLSSLPQLLVVELKKYEKPCKTMEDIRIEHVESSVKKIEEENVGEFWFNINFPVNRFKEIRQTRYTFKQPNNNHKHIVLQSK